LTGNRTGPLVGGLTERLSGGRTGFLTAGGGESRAQAQWGKRRGVALLEKILRARGKS